MVGADRRRLRDRLIGAGGRGAASAAATVSSRHSSVLGFDLRRLLSNPSLETYLRT